MRICAGFIFGLFLASPVFAGTEYCSIAHPETCIENPVASEQPAQSEQAGQGEKGSPSGQEAESSSRSEYAFLDTGALNFEHHVIRR